MRYSREHKEATRRRIIASAADVVRGGGLANASIERIAAAAGVTHGAVYGHFANRDALLAAAIQAAEADLRAPAGSPEALIERYLADPASGAASLLAILAADMPHVAPATRAAFDAELRHLLGALEAAGDPAGTGFARLALMVGGLVLARGTGDADLASRTLEACRRTTRLLPAALAAPPSAATNRFAGKPDFGAADPLPRRVTLAGGTRVAHVDAGAGRPIVFINSISFTAYCWRNVIAHLGAHARCLAPDLPGSGASGPSPRGYRVFDQIDLLEAWLDAIGLERDVVLVGHEWGATMGFELARRRPARIAGIVHLGATLNGTADMYPPLWSGWHRRLREPGGEALLLDDDRMIDRQLSRGTLRRLAPDVAAAYRAMWPRHGESRLPLLRLVQDMPIDGEPEDVAALVAADMRFMATSPIPKLFLRITPGWRRYDPDLPAIRAWPNQIERDLPGVLLAMEDMPDALASAVLDFVERLT